MLIDSFAPYYDASEVHRLEIEAEPEIVYRALWTTNLGGSAVVKGLLVLRSLPAVLLRRRSLSRIHQRLTLQALIEAGFGRLAEEPEREVVLGIAGRFWRPSGNTEPFNREAFDRPVPPGRARAIWNFSVQASGRGRTVLTTETRITCGDESSRLKFRLYWIFVRPFSGLIRIIMLRAVRDACEEVSAVR